ncbi:MAG: hypothetical protein JWO83_4318 [Caulobacteraceae bacterium]|nr:hypothetical protein [Caulobacteraceae bacterium]
MLTFDEVLAMAAALPGAVEADHHGFPSLRVKGKIFCTLRREPHRMMVKLDAEDQHNFCEAHPGSIEPVPGYWGRKGSTYVRYDRIDATLASTLLRLPGRR